MGLVMRVKGNEKEFQKAIKKMGKEIEHRSAGQITFFGVKINDNDFIIYFKYPLNNMVVNKMVQKELEKVLPQLDPNVNMERLKEI